MTMSWRDRVAERPLRGVVHGPNTRSRASKFHRVVRSNAVRSKVPRGSEVGEIPTLSRNCKWSCIMTM